MARYLFLNYELGHAGKNRRMQGFHGKNYGSPCCWNLEYAAQAVTLELTVKEYHEVVRDLARCWHMALRKWIPIPLGSETCRAPEVLEFEAGYNLAMDGQPLPDVASEAAKAGWEIINSQSRVSQTVRQEPHKLPTEGSIPSPATTQLDNQPEGVSVEGVTGGVSDGAPSISAKTPFFALRKIASDEGVSIDGIKGCKEIAAAIQAARDAKLLQPA